MPLGALLFCKVNKYNWKGNASRIDIFCKKYKKYDIVKIVLGEVKIVSFGLPQVARHCTPRAVLGLNRLFLPISTRHGECTQEQTKRRRKVKTTISSEKTGIQEGQTGEQGDVGLETGWHRH